MDLKTIDIIVTKLKNRYFRPSMMYPDGVIDHHFDCSISANELAGCECGNIIEFKKGCNCGLIHDLDWIPDWKIIKEVKKKVPFADEIKGFEYRGLGKNSYTDDELEEMNEHWKKITGSYEKGE